MDRLARIRRKKSEKGSQLLELALVFPVLILIFAGTVDFGCAHLMAVQVASAAEAGALYGLGKPTDTAGMQSAALLDGAGVNQLTVVATYGSECMDGTSPVPAPGAAPVCSTGTVQYVEVDTSATYQPFIRYPGWQQFFTLTGKSHLREPF